MMNKLLLILSFLISITCLTSHSVALPPCPSSGYKHNCHGKYVFNTGNQYIGEWQNNKINGHGKYNYANGDIFEGQFKDSKRSGYGTYTHLSGNKYAGQYVNDHMHGQGTYNFANGDVYVGQYKYAKRNGYGIYTFANGKVQKGMWKDDIFLNSQKKSNLNSTSKLEKYKSFCSEIGFTPGTEKFGECVVEAMKKG